MYLMKQKKGISSVQFAVILEIQQRSACFVLQRLRFAMGNSDDGDKQLKGAVSVDCAFVGGKNKNRHADKKVKYERGSRVFVDKSTVCGMSEQNGKLRIFIVNREDQVNVNP